MNSRDCGPPDADRASAQEPEEIMRPTLGPTISRFVAFIAALAVLAGGVNLTTGAARAESAYCSDLRAQIARAAAESPAARYRAAAARQRAEYARLAARARSMGCDREQFLFFGDPPPPQCAGVNARLNALRGSIAAYDQGGTDDSQRQALAARFDAECQNPRIMSARGPQPRNFFEELFGVAPPNDATGLHEVPVDPAEEERRDPFGENDQIDERPRGGSQAICVRSCDGGFFPLNYTAKNSNLDDLNTLCRALCPNTEAKLYTRSPWKDLNESVSIDGEPYSDHPNALKFQKSYDATCGCKPPGQSWAEALAEAERIIAEHNSKDQVVTVEQAEQMSRPIAPGDARTKKQKEYAPTAGAAREEPLRGTSPALEGAAGEVYREVTGPDGVKRRVRVVAPTL